MRIRTNFFVSLDGKVSDADGRPVQLLVPGFAGAGSYGLPEFLSTTEAVLMGRTTFLPALGAPSWPWTQPVFVLTSSALPPETPDGVTARPSAAALLRTIQEAGIDGDVHLVGGPSTMQAFHAIGALTEVRVHVVPLILGSGTPLAADGAEPLTSLTPLSVRTFDDGVVELAYAVADRGGV